MAWQFITILEKSLKELVSSNEQNHNCLFWTDTFRPCFASSYLGSGDVLDNASELC